MRAQAPGARGTGGLPVFWLHGTPNLGLPPRPLFPASARLGVRRVSYDRPGYGGPIPLHGRSVATAVADVAHSADALGIGRFAVMGHSGGASHALAYAAVLPERVLGVVEVSGPAPFRADSSTTAVSVLSDAAAALEWLVRPARP
ncbi:alpha/beta fold hydrolase [Streptomyces sp. NPDC001450]